MGMSSTRVTVIHEFVEPFRDAQGQLWDVRVLGQERDDGTWIGWLEFKNPLQGTLRTDRETTQSNADALTYWATGLELVYLEGALSRAS
jgi:hypothetical protein